MICYLEQSRAIIYKTLSLNNVSTPLRFFSLALELGAFEITNYLSLDRNS